MSIIIGIILFLLLAIWIEFREDKYKIRSCHCGGTIFWYQKPGRMGGAVCDKCGSGFNSGVRHWTDEQLKQAIISRGVKLHESDPPGI